MAFYTYPTGAAQSMDIFQWRKMRFVENPDQIRSGLEVTVRQGRNMRMASGAADVGGMQFLNDAVDDFTLPENTSGVPEIYRRVLRLTIIADNSPAGGVAEIKPALLKGGGPTGAGLTQMTSAGVGGVLTWEVPVARWALLPNQTVDFLTNDGPGLGVCGWARDSYKIPDNNDNGVPDLYPFKMTDGVYGPQPGAIDGKDVVITVPGIYSMEYSVLLKEAQAAMAAAVKPYIRLTFPGGDERQPFEIGTVDTKRPQDGFAKIVKPDIYLPTGYRIEPRIYQNSGAEQQVLFRFRLSRTGVL